MALPLANRLLQILQIRVFSMEENEGLITLRFSLSLKKG
jgi:hypothetical protein